MRIFLDSGDIDQIQRAIDSFNIHGITTNPKLTSIPQAKKILHTFNLPTSIQFDIRNEQEFWKNVHEITQESPNVVIKVPVNYPKVIKRLVDMSIKVNCTLCFSLSQVVTAANLGADYVSIFLGRMLAENLDATKILRDSVSYVQSNELKTQILAASIRNVEHVELAARSGSHVITLSPEILFESSQNPMTEMGERDFEKWM